jgi:hypothetical protein
MYRLGILEGFDIQNKKKQPLCDEHEIKLKKLVSVYITFGELNLCNPKKISYV